MSSKILISIIIPVYNAEKTLTKCLESIVSQSSRSFEVILVNDGSYDGSQIIINDFISKYPDFIHSIIKKNGGPGAARNEGILAAKGAYISFVDSDDYVEKNYIEVISQSIRAHEPDMIIISYNRIYQKKSTFFERIYKFSTWSYYNTPFDIASKPDAICKLEVASWLRVIKRKILLKEELLFSNFKLSEDLNASLKWYLNISKILIIDQPVYNYLVNSQTLNTKTDHIHQFIDVLQSVCEYYNKRGKFLTFFDELEYIFTKHILLSSLMRLRANKNKGNLLKFFTLRSALMEFFPSFNKNKYLIHEPVFVRIAISISYYFPRFISIFL